MIILMVPGTEQQQVSRLMDQLYGTTRYSANNHGDGILHGNGTMAYQPFADEDALMMVIDCLAFYPRYSDTIT